MAPANIFRMRMCLVFLFSLRVWVPLSHQYRFDDTVGDSDEVLCFILSEVLVFRFGRFCSHQATQKENQVFGCYWGVLIFPIFHKSLYQRFWIVKEFFHFISTHVLPHFSFFTLTNLFTPPFLVNFSFAPPSP